MIRISTKGRYGTRLMLQLALNYGKGPILLKDISKNEAISLGYLEHLIPPLKSAGLIKSIRGARGGYFLSMKPSEIKLKEIIQALEGSLILAECISTPAACNRINFCSTRALWEELSKKMSDILGGVTLQDLVEKNKNQKTENLVYNI